MVWINNENNNNNNNILPVGGKLISAGSPKSHFCRNDKKVKKNMSKNYKS